MLQFRIPCETFLRLANAATPVPEKNYPHAFCVRIEYIGGHGYAIASNSLICAIQYLGEVTKEFEYGVSIIPFEPLLNQCKIEAPFDSELIIDLIYNDVMKFANVKTNFGYAYPGNAAYFPPDDLMQPPYTSLGSWRKLVPDELPKKSKGFMFMDALQISNLGKAAPSGTLVFPSFIDNSQPVVVRDAVDPDWMGLFLPRDDKKSLVAAIIPEWL